MSKRLTLAFVVVLTVVSVTACGMTWSHAQTLRDMAELARAETHQMLKARDEENQQLLDQNRALLEKLTAAAESPPVRSLDWNPLKVRIVLANGEQTPAEGFDVELSGNAHTASEEARLDEATDAAGLADFGVVRPGTYQVRVTCPWGEYQQLSTQVRPGSDRVVEITVPAGPPKPVAVRPRVQWTESLADRGLGVVCLFRRGDGTPIGDRYFYNRTDRYFLILPDGRIAEYDHVRQEGAAKISLGQTSGGDSDILGTVRFYGEPRVRDSGVEWHGSTARLHGIYVVRPAGSEPPEDGATVQVVTPSTYLQTYERMFSGSPVRPTESKRGDDDTVEFSVDEPDWSIVIPEWQVREAVALLTDSDHPDATKSRVALGMMMFQHSDLDGDASLSEEETENSSRMHRIKFSEFPVTQTKFLNAYLESRSPRPAGIPAGRGR